MRHEIKISYDYLVTKIGLIINSDQCFVLFLENYVSPRVQKELS